MLASVRKVEILDKETIDKIAAGEVVERPASLVKELVENALDAHASQIEVEIMAGGTSFVRVTDNGIGMTKEDAKLAILRHATSKISSSKDLLTVATMGFRGEALPTIASVSRFKLITRTKESDLGTQIVIEGEKDPVIGEIGSNFGTTVQVEDLFFNTPARKKFLKTTQTEGNRIGEFLTKFALAHSEIAVRFIKENRLVMSTDSTGELKDTILSIYGSELRDALLALDFSLDEVRVQGYISKPSMIRSSRSWQTFVVNGRIVTNKALGKAVDNAYHSLIPHVGYPFVLIKLEIPARTIDINVHPQKSEIKFEDEGKIFKAIYRAVLKAVSAEGKTLPSMAKSVVDSEKHYTTPILQENFHFAREQEKNILDFAVNNSANAPETSSFYDFYREQNTPLENFSCMEKHVEELGSTESIGQKAEQFFSASCETQLFPLGQIALCYIVATDGTNLYLIDQHAAHERILYDKFSAMVDAIPTQELLVHILLKFGEEEIEILEGNEDLFQKLGFQLARASKDEFRLVSIPCDIPTGEAENVVRKILAHLLEKKETSAANIRHLCLATTACRAAVKAGDELNLRQMEILLAELSRTQRPYTCPHGRPTILRFTEHEMAKMFKRTGF